VYKKTTMLINSIKKLLTNTTNKNNLVSAIRTLYVSSTHYSVRDEHEDNIIAENWRLRCELATAYRGFEKYNMHEGVCNHLSVKAPSLYHKEDIALIIPYGMYWGDVTPDCLVGFALTTGEHVEGVGEVEPTAMSIHRGLYRNRCDIKTVMHMHPRYTTVLSVLKDPEIKKIHQNSARFLNNVAYDQGYEASPLDGVNDEADRLGKVIGDQSIVLLGSHGILTVAERVCDAFDLLYYFEKAAEVQILAYQTGKPLLYLSNQIAESAYNDFQTMDYRWTSPKAHLDGLMKHFQKIDPDFKLQC